jgi:UDP-3-O-[3-hydroxymyristoyl] glucosamine N-acyltransferase
LAELASLTETPVSLGVGGDVVIGGVASLEEATPTDLAVVSSARYLEKLARSAAGAVLGHRSVRAGLEADGRPFLLTDAPPEALREILDYFYPESAPDPVVHPSAWVHPDATLLPGVSVGPLAVIDEGAWIGGGVAIGAHCVIGPRVRVGEGSVLYPHVVLYPDVVLGQRVRIHAGARIGVDGFGYHFDGAAHQRIPQIGGCILEDDVEIGANTCIDRGSTGVTRVGSGTKIDNQVHLGHNVTMGPLGIVIAQAGVSGSTRLGTGVILGGQAGLAGHITVGDGARVAAQAGVIGDVEAGTTVMGFPARPQREFLKAAAAQYRVPELLRRVKALEDEVAALHSTLARPSGHDAPVARPAGGGKAG